MMEQDVQGTKEQGLSNNVPKKQASIRDLEVMKKGIAPYIAFFENEFEHMDRVRKEKEQMKQVQEKNYDLFDAFIRNDLSLSKLTPVKNYGDCFDTCVEKVMRHGILCHDKEITMDVGNASMELHYLDLALKFPLHSFLEDSSNLDHAQLCAGFSSSDQPSSASRLMSITTSASGSKSDKDENCKILQENFRKMHMDADRHWAKFLAFVKDLSAPCFVEYQRSYRISVYYHTGKRMWFTRALSLPSFDHSLHASSPSLLFAVGSASEPPYRLAVSKYTYIQWFELEKVNLRKKQHLIVSRVNDTVLVATSRWDSTRLYNLTHAHNVFPCPPLPPLFEELAYDVHCSYCIHAIPTEKYVLALGRATNTLIPFELESGIWLKSIKFKGLEPGLFVSLAGVRENQLILVASTIHDWYGNVQTTSVWKVDLIHGLPTEKCIFVAKIPDAFSKLMRRHNHHQDAIVRLMSDYLLIYWNPHLWYFNFSTCQWNYAKNEFPSKEKGTPAIGVVSSAEVFYC